MTVKKEHINAAMVFLIYLLFSLVFGPYYFGGDQVFYRTYYEGVSDLGLLEGYVFYNGTLAANEPVFYFVTWLLAGHVEKALLMSVANAALVTAGFVYLKKARISTFVICLLALNYYVFVLMFAAERLKFGALFFLLALLVLNKKRVAFFAMAILSHFQMLILFVVMSLQRLVARVSSGARVSLSWSRFLFRAFPLSVLVIVALGGFSYLFFQTVLSKAGVYYYYQEGIGGIVRPAIFLLLSVHYAKGRRLEAAAMNLPIVSLAYFIGSERLTLFSYATFLYYGLKIRRGLNAGVVITSSYFSIKGLMFLADVYSQGQGFDDAD